MRKSASPPRSRASAYLLVPRFPPFCPPLFIPPPMTHLLGPEHFTGDIDPLDDAPLQLKLNQGGDGGQGGLQRWIG